MATAQDAKESAGEQSLRDEVAALRRRVESLSDDSLRYRALLDASPDPISVYDAEGRIQYVNPAFEQTFGWTLSELRGKGIDFVPPHEVERTRAAVLRTLEGENILLETQRLTKEGRLLDIQLRTAIILGPDGSVAGDIVIYRDVTQQTRRNREERARRELELLGTVLDAIPAPIFAKDDEGVYVACNRAFAEYLGRPKEKIVGTTVYDVAPRDQADIYFKADQDLLASGGTQVYEAPIVGPGGKTRYVMFHKAVFRRPAGAGGGLVGTMLDITERKRAEQALKASQEALQTFVDHSPAVIYAKDAEGRYLFVNERFTTLFGVDRQAVEGQTDRDLFPREVADAFQANDRIVLETRRSLQIEEVAPHADGPHFYIAQKFPLVDERGEVYAVCGVSTDITERRDAERRVLDTAKGVSAATGEALFPSLAQHLATVLGVEVALVGEIVDSGKRVRTLALWVDGQVRPNVSYELAGTPCESVNRQGLCIHPRDVQTLFPHDAMLVEVGAQSYAGTPLVGSRGQILGIMAVLCRRELGDDSQVTSLLQIFAVRAAAELERMRTEANLRASEERFRILVEESPLGVSLIGPDGTYKYVNPTFVTLFGYTLEGVRRGSDWFAKAYPEPDQRREARKAWIEDVTGAGRDPAKPRMFTVRASDGREKIIHFRPVTMHTGDHLVIYEDVTEQRWLEAQLLQSQKMEALGTLASGVAHDFNNLLQAIRGYAELIADALPTGGREREYVGRIEAAAGRAAELVRSLLAFSRSEKPHVRPHDVNRIVKQGLQILEHTLPKMVHIETRLSPDLELVQADATQIEQVLLNLATNARDAMPQGGTLLIETGSSALGDTDCETRLEARPGPHVWLRVGDTGCGMDEATLAHMFEPFFTTKGVGEGTGLGLATVYGIVKGHGGHVVCESRLGRGTVFTVYLPAMPPLGAAVPECRPPAAAPAGGQERVLVADDEPALLELSRSLLESRGYQVRTARSGEEALELYQLDPTAVNLVILDLGMPGMGGRACLEQLRRLDPTVRVIVASGYSTEGQASGLAEAGVAAFVAKPYRVVELLQTVRRVLDA